MRVAVRRVRLWRRRRCQAHPACRFAGIAIRRAVQGLGRASAPHKEPTFPQAVDRPVHPLHGLISQETLLRQADDFFDLNGALRPRNFVGGRSRWCRGFGDELGACHGARRRNNEMRLRSCGTNRRNHAGREVGRAAMRRSVERRRGPSVTEPLVGRPTCIRPPHITGVLSGLEKSACCLSNSRSKASSPWASR